MPRKLKPYDISEIKHKSGLVIPIQFDRNENVFFAEVRGFRVTDLTEEGCKTQARQKADELLTYDWHKIIVVRTNSQGGLRPSREIVHLSFDVHEVARGPAGVLERESWTGGLQDKTYETIKKFYEGLSNDPEHGYFVISWSEAAEEGLKEIQRRIQVLHQQLNELLGRKDVSALLETAAGKLLPAPEEELSRRALMTPKIRKALEILRDIGPASCSSFGARMWPDRETSGVANQGGGDYPAQMLLGRLKKRGFVRHADSQGSSLWELTEEGEDAVGPGTIECRPMRREDLVDATSLMLNTAWAEVARERAKAEAERVRRALGCRYLFLDVDGVLNSTDWQLELHESGKLQNMLPDDWIDPAAIVRLNRIIDATGALVVVSSAWRTGRTLEQLQALFATHGFRGTIAGATGHGHYGERGLQIHAWLQTHPCVSFAVLDDDIHDMSSVTGHLVQTNSRTGLQDDHVEAAIRLLVWEG